MNRKVVSCIVVLLLLPVVTLYSATTGSIEITPMELIKGLFTGANENIEIIKDLRFPRIVISMFAGAALAVSGVLLQAVMRNPLAEPGIIGVSSGAGFFTLLVLTFFPTLFFYTPLFAFIGGAIAFVLVYTFSWRSGLNPLRMILIGVAIHAIFTGFSQLLQMFNASSMASSVSVTQSTLTMKTWSDVHIIVLYGLIGLIVAFFLFAWANHLSLSDDTLHVLGFGVYLVCFIISLVAMFLALFVT